MKKVKKENHFESVEEEVKFLRKQNAGIRGQISVLQEQVRKYKSLDLEGDHLYEGKIAECDSLLKQVDVLEKTNAQLRGQIESYKDQVLVLNDRIGEFKSEADRLAAELSKPAKPWWKRIF
jgi:chromosome segregation ATPase